MQTASPSGRPERWPIQVELARQQFWAAAHRIRPEPFEKLKVLAKSNPFASVLSLQLREQVLGDLEVMFAAPSHSVPAMRRFLRTYPVGVRSHLLALAKALRHWCRSWNLAESWCAVSALREAELLHRREGGQPSSAAFFLPEAVPPQGPPWRPYELDDSRVTGTDGSLEHPISMEVVTARAYRRRFRATLRRVGWGIEAIMSHLRGALRQQGLTEIHPGDFAWLVRRVIPRRDKQGKLSVESCTDIALSGDCDEKVSADEIRKRTCGLAQFLDLPIPGAPRGQASHRYNRVRSDLGH